ncbi:MAG: TNT domain-containing protein [Cellulomonas sp.]
MSAPGFATWRWPDDPAPVTVRPLTADDDLELDRIGYERGDRLHARGAGFAARSMPPDKLETARHGYRVDTTNPLVVDGLVRLEESVAAPWFGQPGGATVYRFLDPNGSSISVRDLRRFRILVEVPL